MITQKQYKNNNILNIIDVSYAGDLIEGDGKNKSYVLNITYTIDKERIPASGISDIVLALSEVSDAVTIPTTGNSPRAFINDALNINANLKKLHSTPQATAMARLLSEISINGTNKGFFRTYALMNPLCISPKVSVYMQTVYDALRDSGRMTDAKKALSKLVSKYGVDQVTSLVTITSENKDAIVKVAPILYSRDGVQGRVVITPTVEEAESNNLDINAAVSLDFNTVLIDSLEGSVVKSAEEHAVAEVISNVVEKRNDLDTPGVRKQISDSQARLFSITKDLMDPAKSALIPRALRTGDRAMGVCTLSSTEKNTVQLSKNLIGRSIFQRKIKNSDNIIAVSKKSKVGDYEIGDVLALPGLRNRRFHTVNQLVALSEKDILSMENIFGKILIGDPEGNIQQSIDFTIPMAAKINDNKLPDTPPTIDVCNSKKGDITLNIAQTDPKATHIDLYFKRIHTSIEKTKLETWNKIYSSPLPYGKVDFFFDHSLSFPGTVVYRVVARNSDHVSSNFSSVVVQPVEDYGKVENQEATSAVLSTEIDSAGNIVVAVNNISGGPQAISLVRKDTTLFEQEYKRIRTVEGPQFANTGDNVYFTDPETLEGHAYEYAILVDSVASAGITESPAAPTTIKYIKPSGHASIKLGPTKLIANNHYETSTQSSQGSSYSVEIPVKITSRAGGSYDMLQALSNLGFSKEELEEVPELNVELNQMVGVIARRIDLSNGFEDYFGFVSLNSQNRENSSYSNSTESKFIDSGDTSKNILPPQPGKKYKYIFEAVLRDAKSVLNTLKRRDPEEISDQNAVIRRAQDILNQRNDRELTFTNDSESGLVKNSENPNNVEKFYDVRTLGSGPNAGTILRPPADLEGEAELGRTGVYKSVDVNISKNKLPEVLEASVAVRSDNRPIITWTADCYEKIDHFLIQELRHGTTSTIASAHSIPANGGYKIVDIDGNTAPGKVEYQIVIVDSSFKKYAPFSAGSVLIQGSLCGETLSTGTINTGNKSISSLIGESGWTIRGT